MRELAQRRGLVWLASVDPDEVYDARGTPSRRLAPLAGELPRLQAFSGWSEGTRTPTSWVRSKALSA
jgi:hypothetical protein